MGSELLMSVLPCAIQSSKLKLSVPDALEGSIECSHRHSHCVLLHCSAVLSQLQGLLRFVQIAELYNCYHEVIICNMVYANSSSEKRDRLYSKAERMSIITV
jgi:hypothetical protein